MNIFIKSIEKKDFDLINVGKQIFMSYFLDLYNNMNSEKIGIDKQVNEYLNTIFEKEKNTFLNDPKLYSCVAFIENKPVGFSFFGPLEDNSIILLRTLPIDITCKPIEIDIRNHIILYVHTFLPTVQKVVVMIRKANKRQELLCLQAGFKKYNDIFEQSTHIQNTYNTSNYTGYSFCINK